MIHDYVANHINQIQENIEDNAKKSLQGLSSKATSVHQFFKVTKLADSNLFQTEWKIKNNHKDILKELDDDIKKLLTEVFETPNISLNKLPPYSFFIQFRFTLAQPYISKDEQDFYIIDNPIRKDKVFGLPYVASTSWKGSLRSAFRKLANFSVESDVRLFGNAKNNEETGDFQAGRLYFYPTFFYQKSLEIINPHDRARRVGKNPILIESVPADTPGVFTLLYVPFNPNEGEGLGTVINDLKLVAEALKAMLLVYGFGAKTSSGFGVVKNEIKQGFLKINKPDRSVLDSLVEPIKPPISEVNIQIIKTKYPIEDFSLKPREWRSTNNTTGKEMEIYTKARDEIIINRKISEKYNLELAAYEAEKTRLEKLSTITCYEFSSLSQLVEITGQINGQEISHV